MLVSTALFGCGVREADDTGKVGRQPRSSSDSSLEEVVQCRSMPDKSQSHEGETGRVRRLATGESAASKGRIANDNEQQAGLI